jgi:hypothetical protein
MTTEQKTKPHKVVFDHGDYLETTDPEGKTKRYTRAEVETLQSLMRDFVWHFVVFKDYSGPAKAAEKCLSDKSGQA